MRIVSNSSPLISLAKIEQLSLLQRLYHQIYVPGAVWQEIVESVLSPDSALIAAQDWIEVIPVKAEMALGIPLDAGEAEAIVLAVQLQADYLIIDERRARLTARDEYNIQLIGTLGILILAKQKKLVEAVSPLLEALIQNGFRLSDSLYTRVKEQAGE